MKREVFLGGNRAEKEGGGDAENERGKICKTKHKNAPIAETLPCLKIGLPGGKTAVQVISLGVLSAMALACVSGFSALGAENMPVSCFWYGNTTVVAEIRGEGSASRLLAAAAIMHSNLSAEAVRAEVAD